MRHMQTAGFPRDNINFAGALVVPMHASSIGFLSAGPGGTDPFVLWFDENGNGRISLNGGPVTSNPGFLGVDPLSGITALYYPLPEAVVQGDAGVSESAGGPLVLSDGLRFENGLFGFAAVMFYFSDNSDVNGHPDLADTGFPSGFPCCVVPEVGPGNNHFDYSPGGNVYHGISDTPEPGSLALFGTGMLGLAGVFRRKLM